METKTKLMEISKGQEENFDIYLNRGQANANKIFQILKIKSNFDISRLKIVGTVGIKSPNGFNHQAEFDLVVFVQNEWAPFENVLANFEKVLGEHYGQFDLYIKRRTGHSLEIRVSDFTTPSGFLSFDLMPATSLLTPVEDRSIHDIAKVRLQTERALKFIKQYPDDDVTKDLRVRGYYSNILSERNIAFVSMQNEFVQDVIRLGKLWNRQVTWSGRQKLYGRSMMIEFLCIAAACLEEHNCEKEDREKSILEAFTTFLKKFLDLDTNMIEFFKFQAILNSHYINGKQSGNNDSSNLEEGELAEEDTDKNTGEELTNELREAFESCANITLEATQNYDKNGHGSNFNLEGYFGLSVN